MARAVIMRLIELQRVGGSIEEGRRRFEWSGPTHSAPQGELELHLQSKVTRKEIPGGRRVVHQTMGAWWQPFDLTGEWDDKWGGREFAWSTYTELAKFAQDTPLVRFTLDEHSVVGLLTDLKIRYRDKTKIFWTMTISPEENETFHDEIVAFDADIIRKPIQEWSKDFQERVKTVQIQRERAKKIPFKKPVLNDFDQLLFEVNDALEKLDSVATRGLESDTERRLRRLAATFRAVRSAAFNVAIGMQKKRSDLEVAYDDVIGTVRYDEWVHTSITELMKVVGWGYSAERDMNRRIGKRPKAIHRCKKGESLERISRKWYGTPDNADTIAQANNLTTWVFDGGEELIIPELAR